MKKRLSLSTLLIIVFISLFSTFVGILSNLVSSQIPSQFIPYLRFAWPLLGIATIAFIGLTIWHTLQQSSSDIDTSHPINGNYQQLIDKRNRQGMIMKVHSFWIKGVLEKSLHGAALIELGLHEQPDAVENPWRLVFQQPDLPTYTLPPGTRITQVYDDASGELLILGEPGSGKTTLLLELARDLLDRASKNDTYPIPVVFNLSSWAVKKQSITDWLIDELNIKYQVPRQIGQTWINSDQILPLLDGLDEVIQEARVDCIDGINTYRKEHGLLPMVVCSRRTEYIDQTARLFLHNAVIIQDLTPQQVDDFLSSAGDQLAALRVALRSDRELQELIQTPLMLSILALAYRGMTTEDLIAIGSIEIRRQRIFRTYIRRMLQRRGTETRYKQQKTIYWLAWLARQLVQHGQTQFYIERMQPDWLPESSTRLYAGISAGIIYGLLVGPTVGLSLGSFYGLVSGLATGLIFGFLGQLDMKLQLTEINTSLWTTRGRNLINLLDNRMVFGFLTGLVGGLVVMLVDGVQFGLPTAIRSGAANGLIAGVAFGLLGKVHTEIQPAETVTWSWITMKRNLIKFLGIALGVGLAVGLIAALFGILVDRWIMELVFGLVTALIAVLLLGLLYGLMSGVSNEMLDESNFVTPNQGIWRSARNCVLIGTIVMLFVGSLDGLLLGTFNGLLYGQAFGLAFGLHHGLRIGLFFGLAVCLRYGGAACIQHLVLRLLLSNTDCAPLDYPRFLNYAANRILLRKVGGGYIFVHRMLLEYFASPDLTEK